MKAVIIAMLVSIGLAWTVSTAQAAEPSPQEKANYGAHGAGLVAAQVDVIGVTSANPVGGGITQWIEADATRPAVLVSWLAVAMLLAFCWFEWARD